MTELSFRGKEFVYNHHLAVPHRPLVPHPDKGIGEVDLDGNLIVHGDNLHALKALLPTHAGRVDCVFIDPPYNTGNEKWSYSDNVSSPLIKEWLNDNPIDAEDGLRHDKWCAMMWPRLRLLHELLSESGSLWMTLDDNEAHRGRNLLDAVFGNDSFVATCVWQKRYSRENRGAIGDAHDYLFIYSKSRFHFTKKRNKITPSDTQLNVYKNTNGDPRGRWRGIPMTAQGFRRNQMYPITTPTGVAHMPPEGRCWGMVESEFEKLREEGRIWFGKDGNSQPSVIRYLDEIEGFVPWTWWPNDEVGHTDEAKKEMHTIFGRDDAFPTPKPTRLLDRVVEIATEPDSIVLDSFAGSGTTAHAVLKANARDGGSRRFVLVEMEDYADALTAERVRRVMNGYPFTGTQREELLREKVTWTKLKKADKLVEQVEALENLHGPSFDRVTATMKDGELIVTGERKVEETAPGLGGTFTYCTLGDPVDMDRILSGDALPDEAALAALLHYTVTSRPIPAGLPEPSEVAEGLHHLGEDAGRHLWMIYRPDLDWLKGPGAALNLDRARAIAGTKDEGARHFVFAAARYVGDEVLRDAGLNVEFAPLPYALYRVVAS